MIAREHEQAAMSGTDDEPVSDNSYANDADEEDVALFIERLTKYTDMQELTREMCLELIEYITLDAYVEGQPREIYIYYKLLDEQLKDKTSLF